MHYDHVIIGTGIAGVTAAETIRGRDANTSIALFGDEPHAPYSRVLLPRLVQGVLPEERVYLKTATYFTDNNITLIAGNRVVAVQPDAHEIVLADGQRVGYGKLLIATGGAVRRLACAGADTVDCAYFQTLDDARALRTISDGPAVVVGGGFIAMELLMAYVRRGSPVMLVTRGPALFSRHLDLESAARLEGVLEKNGVAIKKSVEVRAVAGSGSEKTVSLSDKTTTTCAHIGVGIGLEANIGFLAGSGIPCAEGVLVDATLRVPGTDVYAAGDVAQFEDALVGARRLVGNWTNALFQGKTVGKNMSGAEETFSQLTAYTISCFGLSVAFLGASDVASDDKLVRVYEDGSILQLKTKNGRVVGATSVGIFSERAAVTKLIEQGGVSIGEIARVMAAPQTPISSLFG